MSSTVVVVVSMLAVISEGTSALCSLKESGRARSICYCPPMFSIRSLQQALIVGEVFVVLVSFSIYVDLRRCQAHYLARGVLQCGWLRASCTCWGRALLK